MTIGERIKNKRLQKGLTLENLAKMIGTSRQNVQRYEAGIINNIPSDKIEALAKALNVSAAYLMGWEDSIPNGFDALPQTIKKPRLGAISCGEPIDSAENFDGYDNVPEHIRCDFTLKAEGDSMTGARINNGDIVYIRQQETAESGQIAAVLLDGSEKLLKRIYINSDNIILQAENPRYSPLVFSGAEMNRIRIIGIAVGFTSVI